MSKPNPIETARKVFDVEAQAILSLKDRMNDSFLKVVELVTACKGKVVLTGIGKSGQIARKIASTFSSTGTPSVFLHPAESSHGDLGLIAVNDLVIAISYGGETPELTPVLNYLSRKNIPLVAITGNISSELSKRALATLDVKISREACPLGLAPTASSTATLAMGDAVAMAVLEQKGFSSEDFAVNHPGGGLGFRLSRVKDLMHTGKSMPLVQQSATMKQIITLLSQGDVRGAVGVVDAKEDLIGIITDGNIRRTMENAENPLGKTATELMTANPKTIDASEIAEKALFMMEQFRLNVLLVLDHNSSAPKKPVGIIHVQDLIRAKVR